MEVERVIIADKDSNCIDFAHSVYDNIKKLEEEKGKSGFKMGYVEFARFPDGEIEPRIQENCRGRHIIFIHDSSKNPRDWWIELMLVNDAARRGDAEKIINVLPYMRWSRAEKKDKPHISIPARVLLDTMSMAGVGSRADRIITMDLHAPALQGFTNLPFDNLYSFYCSVKHIVEAYPKIFENLSVAAPDVGSVKLARAYSKRIMEYLAKKGKARDIGLAVVNKNRISGDKVETGEVMGDIEGKNVLVVDDILSSASTLKGAREALLRGGAKEIIAYATHFVGQENIQKI